VYFMENFKKNINLRLENPIYEKVLWLSFIVIWCYNGVEFYKYHTQPNTVDQKSLYEKCNDRTLVDTMPEASPSIKYRNFAVCDYRKKMNSNPDEVRASIKAFSKLADTFRPTQQTLEAVKKNANGLNIVFDDGMAEDSAGEADSDGTTIRLNTNRVKKFNTNGIEGLLSHELRHTFDQNTMSRKQYTDSAFSGPTQNATNQLEENANIVKNQHRKTVGIESHKYGQNSNKEFGQSAQIASTVKPNTPKNLNVKNVGDFKDKN
jgi:predicted SprT family Zn-dependent metalloprotease